MQECDIFFYYCDKQIYKFKEKTVVEEEESSNHIRAKVTGISISKYLGEHVECDNINGINRSAFTRDQKCDKMTSLVEKIKILEKLAQRISLEEIAADHGVDFATIIGIHHNHEIIIDLMNSAYYQKGLKLSRKTGMFPEMENILFEWCCEQPGKDQKTAKDLGAKALEILSITNENGYGQGEVRFLALPHWATGFRKRYGIVYQRSGRQAAAPAPVDANSGMQQPAGDATVTVTKEEVSCHLTRIWLFSKVTDSFTILNIRFNQPKQEEFVDEGDQADDDQPVAGPSGIGQVSVDSVQWIEFIGCDCDFLIEWFDINSELSSVDFKHHQEDEEKEEEVVPADMLVVGMDSHVEQAVVCEPVCIYIMMTWLYLLSQSYEYIQ